MPLVLLRPPDFGNRFRFVPNTRIHRNAAGELRLLQSDAPIWESFSGHYQALKAQQIADFRAWVTSSFGKEVKIEDFEGRVWQGIITSTSIPILNGRTTCEFQTEFEFEGAVIA